MKRCNNQSEQAFCAGGWKCSDVQNSFVASVLFSFPEPSLLRDGKEQLWVRELLSLYHLSKRNKVSRNMNALT